MQEKLQIDYYTDILCVWAWIAQRRIEELDKEFGAEISIRHRYIDVFGDTQTRMHTQWKNKGLYDGFADHVVQSALPYEEAIVSDKVWRDAKPTTSANAHLMIKAIEIAYDHQIATTFALRLRRAFFVDGLNISDMRVLRELIEDCDPELVNKVIENGAAMAALLHDYQDAHEQNIKGSPSYIMNEGRQILFGNVGYRVLVANVEELLSKPDNQASWC